VPALPSLEARWKVLSDLLVELRSKGADLPAEVVRDLRLARSLIETLKVAPTGREEITAKIEQMLVSVEAYLLAEAEVKLGPEEAKRWRDKIEEAAAPGEETLAPAEMRFRPGLPRGEHWVRVRVSEDMPREMLETLAAEEGVSARLQPDGFLLVSGEEEKVRAFIRKLAERVRGRPGR